MHLKQDLTWFYQVSMGFGDEKQPMLCLWLQEKSYGMEGTVEAESAGDKAKKMESSFF